MDQQRLPPDLRPRALASLDLVLEAMHLLREASELDYESLMIACLVNATAIRHLLKLAKTDPDLVDLPVPPDNVRGAISRMAVADILGLPRETVRRKVNQMVAMGFMVDCGHGKIRPVRDLANPRWQAVVNGIHLAATRYTARLEGLAPGKAAG